MTTSNVLNKIKRLATKYPNNVELDIIMCEPKLNDIIEHNINTINDDTIYDNAFILNIANCVDNYYGLNDTQ